MNSLFIEFIPNNKDLRLKTKLIQLKFKKLKLKY